MQENPLWPCAQVSEYLGTVGFCTISPETSVNVTDVAIMPMANMVVIPAIQAVFLSMVQYSFRIIYYFLKYRNNVLILIKVDFIFYAYTTTI